MSPTVLESKKAISWHRVWRKRAARILKRFQYSMFLPNLTSLPSFMMVCMKMLPEWRREEQSFARRRLEKDLKKKETRNPSPEDEDCSGAGVVNAAEKGRVTEKRRKSQVLKA